MKIVFVHDHIFLTKNKKVYSNTFSYTMLKRYVNVFSKVTVLARSVEVDEVPDMLLSSGEGVSFIFLESISTVKSFLGLRQKHKKKIEKILLEHDAVIVRLPSELGFLTAKVAKKIDKECLTEVVGCAWDAMWNYGGVTSKVYAPFFFFTMKKRVKDSTYTSYVTKQFLQHRYPSSNHGKTLGVSDIDLTDSTTNTLVQRIKKIENANEKIIFGTIASLSVPYKGIEIALKTLSQITNKHSHFEYHILGEGDFTSYKIFSEKLGISKKVFFDGSVPSGESVWTWLDAIDIYLQPSIAEGLPRALIEAMSRGCPCIGSSVGGIPELLSEDMIFSHQNPQKFSQIIQILMEDKNLMLDVAKRNFHEAKKHQKSFLDEKRNTFFMDFKNDIYQSKD